jgi:hypothetical protein
MIPSATEQARRFVGDWLISPEWSTAELRKWLVGDDFPLPDSDEPFLWMLRGLPEGHRYAAETTLAERVAVLLNERPDQDAGREPRLLFNLLHLCAGLAYREVLGEPLNAMFERHRKDRSLDREYHEIPLSHGLRAALVSNQVDSSLRPEWFNMVEGRAEPYLPGNIYDGLDGLRRMPRNRDSWGDPVLDDFGWALTQLARHLENRPNRRAEFRRQLAALMATYPGRDWGWELLQTAENCGWPDWTDLCLPSLCIPRGESTVVWVGGLASTILDQFYDDVIAEPYLKARFLIVSNTSELMNWIPDVVCAIQQYIRSRPHMSERDYAAQDIHLNQHLERHLRPDHWAVTGVRAIRTATMGVFSGRSQ